MIRVQRFLAAVISAAVVATGAATPTDAATRRTATTTPLQVATYNVWHDAVRETPDAVVSDLVALTRTAKVIGLQEAGFSVLPLLRKVQVKTGYRLYYPADSAIEPLLYAPDLATVRTHSFLLNERIDPLDALGGSAKKYLNVVSFSYGGRRIHVGNVHTIVGPNATPERNDLARRQYSGAVAGMAELRGVRFIVGDFNTNPADHLREVFNVGGYTSTHDAVGWKPTHGTSLLDDILVRGGSRISFVSSVTRDGASDHRAFIGYYTVNAG